MDRDRAGRLVNMLNAILARKRREIARRVLRRPVFARLRDAAPIPRGDEAAARLRRDGALKVIAEVKFASPSAGAIRTRGPGDAARIGAAFRSAGASAVSVLADGPGFSGSALTVRQVARAVEGPVLFKEFVLDPIQIDVARIVGATMVLLLVRALDQEELHALVAYALAQGLAPVVEAADAEEVATALATQARIIGVNARDLRTFEVDLAAAESHLRLIPRDRVAVFMSGVRDRESFARVSAGRADAVLIGEALMRAEDPASALRDVCNS